MSIMPTGDDLFLWSFGIILFEDKVSKSPRQCQVAYRQEAQHTIVHLCRGEITHHSDSLQV